MSKISQLLPVLGILLPLAACETRSGPGTESVAVEALYHHNQCQAETANTFFIDNAADLSAWWQPLARLALPARELPSQLERIDWRTTNIVVVNAGSRPSAGYAIELPGEAAQVKNQTLNIDVRLTEPPADAMVAQVITSPCVVIAARKNSYTAVKVKDGKGKIIPVEP